MARQVPIGVLISGGGTNLQAIIDAIEAKNLDAKIRVVLSNKADAYGLARAKQHGIATEVLDHKSFASREDYDQAVVDVLRARGVELVILAGFMRLLSPVFIKAYSNRIMNIHPALLPSFPGLHVQKKALEHGVRFAGCTVHFVNEECDEGPIIIQAVVPVYPDDNEADACGENSQAGTSHLSARNPALRRGAAARHRAQSSGRRPDPR